MIWVMISRAHNGRREWTTTLSLMPAGHAGCAPQPATGARWRCGERTASAVWKAPSATCCALNLQAFGGQSGSAASCRLGGISSSFESHEGINTTLRGSPFLLISPLSQWGWLGIVSRAPLSCWLCHVLETASVVGHRESGESSYGQAEPLGFQRVNSNNVLPSCLPFVLRHQVSNACVSIFHLPYP